MLTLGWHFKYSVDELVFVLRSNSNKKQKPYNFIGDLLSGDIIFDIVEKVFVNWDEFVSFMIMQVFLD